MPGAGKSWVVRDLASHYVDLGRRVKTVADEEAFFAARAEDIVHAHHQHPWGDERLRHTDGYLFDASVIRLHEAVIAASQEEEAIVIAELARGHAHPAGDVSYRRAVLLAPELFSRARLVVYVRAPWEVRRCRNENRLAEGAGTPPDVMDELYRDDDFEQVSAAHSWPVMSLDNGPTGITVTDRELLLRTLEGDSAP